MNARLLTRSSPAVARQLAVSRTVQPVVLAKRFVASEAIGPELAKERDHHKDHAAKSADMWRKVSIYVCVPFSIVLGVYIYGVEAEHLHHRDHEIHENNGELPETTVYEYNDIRKKPFPWAGDGKNNSFFFNPKANRNVEM